MSFVNCRLLSQGIACWSVASDFFCRLFSKSVAELIRCCWYYTEHDRGTDTTSNLVPRLTSTVFRQSVLCHRFALNEQMIC